MKFTLSWLKKYLHSNATLLEITESLTNQGFEVEEIIDRSNELKNFEVAKIIEAIPHPSADKLQSCKVQTKSEVLDIICGAPNARENIKVVLARIGAIIPGGNFKIKESEIRGLKSQGMLCSAEELLIEGDNNGIIELPEEAVIGDSFIKYYGLDDPIIHVNVTPNRGDGLSVYGLARDLAAKNGELVQLNSPLITPTFTSEIYVDIKDPNICPLFAIREIKNLQNKPSPKWLQDLLHNIGIGSISAVVDVTNYICFTFGQPMHAYDADKIKGGLRVKIIQESNKIEALNGKEYNIIPEDIVISDEENIQCLAGIIGSIKSACNPQTSNILLEAASFNSEYIAKTGRRLQINTDSRYRFERKIDLNFTLKALDIATQMILSICGGEVSELILSKSLEEFKSPIINFPLKFLEEISGINLPTEIIIEILSKLGFSVKAQDNNLEVEVPSWRHDINIKEDIVEEILRIHGYNFIPMLPPPNCEFYRIIPREMQRNFNIKRMLASRSYDEVVTWSFASSKDAAHFSPLKDELYLQNPISIDLNYMRPTILVHLLKIIEKNQARSINDISIFEIGPIFNGINPHDEILQLCGIRCGSAFPINGHYKPRLVTVFDIKGDLEFLFNQIGLSLDKCQLLPTKFSYYHPGRSKDIYLGKNLLGTFGEVHPLILKIFNIKNNIFTFEINLNNLPLSKPKFGYREESKVSDFQITKRDFAFIIDHDQPIGEILSWLNNFDKKLIKSVNLFDIYEGEKLQKGKKSIAFSIDLLSNDKTLTEAELSSFSVKLVNEIKNKFNVILR